MKVALFASGTGSNVQAMIDAVQAGKLKAELVALVCDNPKAAVIEKGRQAGIDTLVLAPKDCPSRQVWQEEIRDFLKKRGVELIVLAGFMRIIGEVLLKAFPHSIMNIHPSLLPKHPGRHGIEDTFNSGDSQGGVTVHWVDEGIDTGEIIAQEAVDIQEGWTLEDLERAIHKIEHRLYPATVQAVIDSRKS